MNHKIGDIVKWASKSQGRDRASYLYSRGLGPKPHDLTGTIVANVSTKKNFTHGYFSVIFCDGRREAIFGEDLKACPTIRLVHAHPHQLSEQEANEWIEKRIQLDDPNFLIKRVPKDHPADGGGWPEFKVSGEYETLRDWYVDKDTGYGGDADEFDEWITGPYQIGNHPNFVHINSACK